MGSTQKSFEDIHDAYAFFQEHSTEARECARALKTELLQLAPPDRDWTLLDFGCGAGEFTARLLDSCGFSPQTLSLHLVEPDPTYRQTAAQRLAVFTEKPIATSAELSALEPSLPTADLVLTNHVLYYVADLPQTFSSLEAALKPGGTLLVTLANRQNALLQGWDYFFGLLEERCPFFTAESLDTLLAAKPSSFERRTILSRLEFPDTKENRSTILRFLLGKHLQRLPDPDTALEWFDRFQTGTSISMPLVDELFCVRRSS